MKTIDRLWIAAVCLSLFSLVNCSNIKFGSQGSNGSSSGTDNTNGTAGTTTTGDAGGSINQQGGGTGSNGNNGGGDISNAGGDPGPITGVGNADASELPKVQFIGPPCIRLTDCSVTFKLDKAYAKQTEFDWKTNDSLYGTPPDPGQPPWGEAGVHYVSTSGHVVFAPGETEHTVYIKNINPDPTLAISIGVLMSMCTYESLLESCQKFFSQ